MPHLVNERKALWAICFIGLGMLVLARVKLFPAPVLVSEKSLGLLLLAIVLVIGGSVLAIQAVRKVGE